MAVQASRKNPGRRGFAATSGAAEQVRMIDPISSESLHQWFGYLRLTDELRKRLGSVSSIKGSHHTVSLPGTHDQTWVEGKTPRAPTRAQLPLLRFRPRGVSQVSATRGATLSLSLG